MFKAWNNILKTRFASEFKTETRDILHGYILNGIGIVCEKFSLRLLSYWGADHGFRFKCIESNKRTARR
jgi:hypothetical protein